MFNFNKLSIKTNGGSLDLSGLKQFVPKSYGLSFDDLINTKSFSSGDLSGSIKAVAILFIRLIITTLSVTLGILKALLDVVLSK